MWETINAVGGNLIVVGVLVILFVGAAIWATRDRSEAPPDGKSYPWLRLEDVLAVIRDPAWCWARNWRCKYIGVRMDTRTRTNLCVIYDRSGKPITLDELKFQERFRE